MRFFRSTAVPELYAASATAEAPSAGTVVCWFLLPQGGAAAAQLTLAESWALPGCYCFLETALPAGADRLFADGAWPFLVSPALQAPRIAWFDSGVPTARMLAGYVLSTSPLNPAVTGRTLVVSYRNYALMVDSGTGFGIDLQHAAFTLAQSGRHPISLSAGFGASTLTGLGDISIPLTGESAGCLRFALTLGRTGGVSDQALLDIGLRSYYPTPDGQPGDNAGLLTSLRYPLFEESQGMALSACLAPWSVAESRSYFRFADQSALASNHVTVTGYRLALRPYCDDSGPSATPARLVFADRPLALSASPDDLYTLIPKGDFAASVDGPPPRRRDGPTAATPMVATSQPNERLMCGLSGVEYIGLDAARDHALSYFTGQAAYAQGFDPAQRAATSLTAAATTAWALPSRLDGAGPLTYFAQPDHSVLFQPTSAGGLAPLVYLEVAANALPATVAAAHALPLFPYRGVAPASADESDLYQALESKVLSPGRRALIAALGGKPPPAQASPGAASAGALSGVTPQGLLARFSDTSLTLMSELVLAMMADEQRFSLRGLPSGSALRTALASNQLFLVLSNPAAVSPYLPAGASNNHIGIEGWNFNLDPAVWSQTGPAGLQGTTLVFKFANGTLLDLASNTGAWSRAQPAQTPFNLDDKATARRIGKLIDAAIGAYDGGKGDLDFKTFVEAVSDPQWQGILILNAAVPLSELPQQCRGLAAGIDPARFHGHHIGINIAKIQQGPQMTVQPSSMFALIHYAAPNIPQIVLGGSYQFQVDSLKVLFQNSAISAFTSSIELAVNTLFGDTVALEPARRNLLLFGVMQRQTIGNAVVDSYLFQTAQNQAMLFPLAEGSVLRNIQVASAQFVTELDTGDGLTHTYFALAGLLDFVKFDELDLLSFGAETTQEIAGLSYSKLLVRMAFAPAVAGSNQFVFDAGRVSFDLARSTARSDSLYQHFPLSLTGLIQATQGAAPPQLGYLSVQSPLTQSALSLPWYGLVFDLDLGTLGALAAREGFVAQLLAAWSPSSGSSPTFVGLKLPGSDGGKGNISIEGVLDLGFRALVLGRNGASTYYLLLNALALKFLSLSFPPGGQIDMALFGNPDDQHNASPGWYAAYTKDQAQQPSGGKDRASFAALRGARMRTRRLPDREPS
ncbi:hypothetical protein [Duganella sp. S19_KUP01_CR8]|uniref:hypothetical protein n=1 Tax=Duganella sp. S19_KUP01_CR8 TaxID=3025502 RepID=UPI002FCD7CB1